MRRFYLLSAIAFLWVLTPCAEAQGFGNMGKKKITLHRKLPAVIHFTGTTFNVKSLARESKNAEISGTLKDLLETELLKNNDKLKVETGAPELLVTCTVVDFDIPPPTPFTRTEVVLDHGKQIEQPVRYYKMTGSLDVAYQAKDTHGGRTLDADTISAKYSEDFEQGANQQGGKSLGTKMIDPFRRAAGKKTDNASGPPTVPELQAMLLKDAVHQIASHITVTDEPVDIMLAQGKLDKTNKIAENGLWTKYLEELEEMKPLQTPKDDSYRMYNIGVAYEAQAYQSEDHEAAKKYLQEAAIRYGKAIDANPAEKYFLPPQKRIETAMAYYRKLDSPVRTPSAPPSAVAASPAPAAPKTAKSTSSTKPGARTTSVPATSSTPATSAPSAPTKAGSPTAPALTNEQIIKMFKAGVDEESIISTIHDAPVVNFDLTPDGQIALASGGVKGKIAAAMRARAKLPNRRAAASGSN